MVMYSAYFFMNFIFNKKIKIPKNMLLTLST